MKTPLQWRTPGGSAEPAEGLQIARDLGVKLSLVVIVKSQGCVDLRQFQTRVLLVDRVCAPAVSNVVQNDLHHFHVGALNPRYASVISDYPRDRFNRSHGNRLAAFLLRINPIVSEWLMHFRS